MGTGLKTNRKRLAAVLLLAAAAVLLFRFVWLAPDTHSDSISVLVMETSGLKPSEGRSEILLPDDPRYAQLLALVNSQSYRRYFDQSSRGVQAGGGKGCGLPVAALLPGRTGNVADGAVLRARQRDLYQLPERRPLAGRQKRGRTFR